MSRFSLVDLWLMRSGVRIKSGGAAVTRDEECLSACDDRNRLFMSLDNASNAAVVVGCRWPGCSDTNAAENFKISGNFNIVRSQEWPSKH